MPASVLPAYSAEKQLRLQKMPRKKAMVMACATSACTLHVRHAEKRGPAERRYIQYRCSLSGRALHARRNAERVACNEPVMILYSCDRLSMRVKIKETHAAQTVSAYNIHRISDEKHSCSISFWGSFTSTFSRSIINMYTYEFNRLSKFYI